MDLFSKREIVSGIYREGGFSKAARSLHIAQPSLSVMVSNIEKEIGARLFDRSTSPVRLTQIGEKYLECCANVSMIEEDFLNYVNDIKGIEVGKISLGGTSLYMSNIIPGILNEYSAMHPSIHIELYDHDTPTLINMLLSGELDIAIDNLPHEEDQLMSHYLGTEFMLLAVPKQFSVNDRLSRYAYTYEDITASRHTMQDRPYLDDFRRLKDQPFILLQDGFDTRVRCDKVFKDYGLSVKPLYELNQLSSAFGMAASGLGITVVSDTIVRHTPGWSSHMFYYQINHSDFTRDVCYYTRKHRMLSMAIAEFIEVSRSLHPFTLSSK
jgi:DNA-binding transcriptional LysR family regulator